MEKDYSLTANSSPTISPLKKKSVHGEFVIKGGK